MDVPKIIHWEWASLRNFGANGKISEEGTVEKYMENSLWISIIARTCRILDCASTMEITKKKENDQR